MADAALLSRVKAMNPADRLALIGAVWDTLFPADAPVTEKEKALLDARLADLENNPQDQSPWSEVKTRLEQDCLGLRVDKGMQRNALRGLERTGIRRVMASPQRALTK